MVLSPAEDNDLELLYWRMFTGAAKGHKSNNVAFKKAVRPGGNSSQRRRRSCRCLGGGRTSNMTSPDVTTFLRRYAVSARLATLCHRECGKTHQPKLGWVDRRSTRTRRRCSKRASSISREMGEAPGLLRGLRLSPTPLEEGGVGRTHPRRTVRGRVQVQAVRVGWLD